MAEEFTAEIADALYEATKSVISKIAWKVTASGAVFFLAAVLVDGPSAEVLDLSGYWSWNFRHQRPTWGFTLAYRGHVVRSYDRATAHKNPGEKGRIRGPHKHRFHSSRIPRYAYKPSPEINDADPNDALFDFLNESHIAPPTDYQRFMFSSAAGKTVQG